MRRSILRQLNSRELHQQMRMADYASVHPSTDRRRKDQFMREYDQAFNEWERRKKSRKKGRK